MAVLRAPEAKSAQHEKTMVALASVGAAVGLTGMKVVVALLTGSLGILAEAAHSGLDLVAALLTFFAVRVADRPADASHPYGHNKVENLSAFFESGLLLVTALWVIYEAMRRLFLREGHVDVTIWAFGVMAVSIAVDATRSRALQRVARRQGSQALEADAMHFRTDIWSSAVVILGLALVALADRFAVLRGLGQADAVAALGVSAIVCWVSFRLARETIDALLDRAPESLLDQVRTHVAGVAGVIAVARVRVRRAGNKVFADVVIEAPRTYTFEQTHTLTEAIEAAAERAVRTTYPQAEVDVVVHVEPAVAPTESVIDQIHYLAETHGVHAHDIRVREVGGRLEADFDVEVHADMSLREAHEAATRLEEAVLAGNGRVARVTTHLEAPAESIVPREDVTASHTALVRRIIAIADGVAGAGSAHDVHLYRAGGRPNEGDERLDLVLHLTFDAEAPISQVHIWAEEIERTLRQAFPMLESVVIHTEPEGVY
jgi:cation diffusion facilitator family transporter